MYKCHDIRDARDARDARDTDIGVWILVREASLRLLNGMDV